MAGTCAAADRGSPGFALNYRHAFHAGNFADLVKHAALIAILDAMQEAGRPLTVVDTHAGAGLYDLTDPLSRKSGEAEAGVGRLMAEPGLPASLEALKAAVRQANPGGGLTRYPGSPWLIARALRPGDTYFGCELRQDDHALLTRILAGRPGAKALRSDGYLSAVERLPPTGSALLVIDPPFERADDYGRIAETLSVVLARRPDAVALVWLPLKDLETFDAFLREIEDRRLPGLTVAETRIRPLSDPLKMNGCALLAVNTPPPVAAVLPEICRWTAENLGEEGKGRVWALPG